MQFKHNQFSADLSETLKENPKRFWSYCKSKTKNIHSATNPYNMAWFNKYFELASSNNTGQSLAFVVAVITSSLTKISFFH